MRQSRLCLSVFHQLTTKRFAGHSKWQNIRHTKAAKDAEKATVIQRFARMTRLAIQEGGSPNPDLNSYLRTVLDQAVKANVPMETMKNQIKKFNANDAQLKRHFLEIKSLNRIFYIVEVYTENLTGLKHNINTALRKTGQSSMADIKHFFNDMGFIQARKTEGTFADAAEFEEKTTEDAIECDAQEVEDIDFATKSASFICKSNEIERVKRALLDLGYTIDYAEHVFIPINTLKLGEAETKVYETLKQKLTMIDGVENIFDNVEVEETSS